MLTFERGFYLRLVDCYVALRAAFVVPDPRFVAAAGAGAVSGSDPALGAGSPPQPSPCFCRSRRESPATLPLVVIAPRARRMGNIIIDLLVS